MDKQEDSWRQVGGRRGEEAREPPSAGLLVWLPGTLVRTRLGPCLRQPREGQRSQCEGLRQSSPHKGSEAAWGKVRAVEKRVGRPNGSEGTWGRAGGNKQRGM